jgi:hypothetical protein
MRFQFPGAFAGPFPPPPGHVAGIIGVAGRFPDQECQTTRLWRRFMKQVIWPVVAGVLPVSAVQAEENGVPAAANGIGFPADYPDWRAP